VPAIDIEPDRLRRLDRLSRWFFWILWASIVLVAAAFYYEKAADNRSAFVRWRPQVLQFWDGLNIYGDKMNFPNPPIMPITLYPLMVLPTVAGAMCWFAIKVALTTATLMMCLEIVQSPARLLPPMFRSLILLLSLRPILGDFHHGNNNLVILFLIVAMFCAWRSGYDVVAGLLLALAASYKVTPALFFIYFAYKRSWRTVGWGALGLVLFLLIVPSAIIGPQFNWECLTTWYHRMVTPFVVKHTSSPQEVNQSLFGVLTRLLTEMMPGRGRYQVHLDLNLASWPPWLVNYLIKAVALGFLGLLAFLCRTPTKDRRDSRLLGEVALVVLTMLFVSERSWKHHYVTVVIPYCYLVAEFFSSRLGPRSRALIVGSWAVSFSLMAATSTEVGGWFGGGQGHEIAQGYGSFLWAGVVLYATVAWRVWVRRGEVPSPQAPPGSGSPEDPEGTPLRRVPPRLISRRCRSESPRLENSL
jgi:alpha-1,2-mannosyltransferase